MFKLIENLKIETRVDDRGELVFSNELNLLGVKRFYIIKNHSINFVRAWHGHLEETKIFLPLMGTFKVSLVKPDNWDNPDKKTKSTNFILSESSRTALVVPPGYFNGTQNLTSNNLLLVFSTFNLEESLKDDYRLNYDYWNEWEINQR